MLAGHYVAYCRDRRRWADTGAEAGASGGGSASAGGTWRRYDDAAVREVQPADVAQAARTDGYLLFYQRCGEACL